MAREGVWKEAFVVLFPFKIPEFAKRDIIQQQETSR
jgi:hypothetical protein